MSTNQKTTTPPAKYNNKEQGWKTNTELCVDLKTQLRRDSIALGVCDELRLALNGLGGEE